MIVLGIDPGSYHCGYGCIKYGSGGISYLDSGRISLARSRPLPERLKDLSAALAAIVDQLSPDVSAVEKVFFAKSVKAALSLGQARGVVLASVASKGVPVFEYSALEVKKSVVGYGRADKAQVQDMVSMLLSLKKPLKEDEADALAVAICQAHTRSGPRADYLKGV